MLREINTALGGLMAQAAQPLPKEPDKMTQLMTWLDKQIPGLSWGLAAFALMTLAVAAVAKLTGNLDKIFSFFRKYFGKAEIELSEPELSDLRRKLLEQMKTNVALRLEDSLHNLVRVDLEQEEQRHQVGRRKDSLVKTEPKRPQLDFKNLVERGLSIFKNNPAIAPVEPAEKTYSIFHRDDIGGRLLILGEPGAGKTTELLTVAQRLVEAAIDDTDKPIPILFELSSWTPGAPILPWFGRQLQQSYGVSKKRAETLVRQWIERTQFLPLLDGLDELGQSNQIACIEALEDFLAQHPALSAIVCCRREEYEQGRQQLNQLNGAIYLQAVGPQQIQQYLEALGQEQLWDGIQSEPELLNLAQSPLFLTMLVVAYQGEPIRDRDTLFDAYIQQQLHEPSRQGAYKPGKEKTPEQTLYYLSWLAKQLKKRNETEFLIENLQPDWLGSNQQRRIYRLIFGLSGGLRTIELKEQLKWVLRKGLIVGLRVGLRVGLLFGLLFGLIGGLIGGLSDEAIEQKQVPNQGTKKSLQNGLRVGLSFGLSFGLVGCLSFGLLFGLLFGLSFGLLFGLSGGLSGVFQHCILRIFLTSNGDTPWNYAQFLEHAVHHRFIQRTGGRYRFIHDLLRQHFAQMTPEQQALLAQDR